MQPNHVRAEAGDEDDRLDAVQGRAEAGRIGEIAHDELDRRKIQRLGLFDVSHQRPGLEIRRRNAFEDQPPDRAGASDDENHDGGLPAPSAAPGPSGWP